MGLNCIWELYRIISNSMIITPQTHAHYPDRDEEIALMAAVKAGSEDACRQLMVAYSNFALSYISRHVPKVYQRGEQRESILAAAAVGLWKAALRYDPDKGTRYTTLAFWYLKKHVNEVIYTWSSAFEHNARINSCWSTSLYTAANDSLDISSDYLDEYNMGYSQQDYENSEYGNWMVTDLIQRAGLDEVEAEIFRLSALSDPPMTNKAIGVAMNIPMAKVNRIKKKVYNKIRGLGSNLGYNNDGF